MLTLETWATTWAYPADLQHATRASLTFCIRAERENIDGAEAGPQSR